MSKLKSFALILGVLIMSFLVGYLVFAWGEAPGTPPTCPVDYPGCAAPLNVGLTDQTKQGALFIGGGVTAPVFKDSGDTTYFIDPAGQAVTNYSAILKGTVGIGTTTPKSGSGLHAVGEYYGVYGEGTKSGNGIGVEGIGAVFGGYFASSNDKSRVWLGTYDGQGILASSNDSSMGAGYFKNEISGNQVWIASGSGSALGVSGGNIIGIDAAVDDVPGEDRIAGWFQFTGAIKNEPYAFLAQHSKIPEAYYGISTGGKGGSINYGVYSEAESADGDSTATNYAFYGKAYGGANNWGLYIEGDKSYFGGNVGIGTRSPGARLEVASSSGTEMLRLRHTPGAGNTGSVDLFAVRGGDSSITGDTLCANASGSQAICLGQWSETGARWACTVPLPRARALCADFGD